MQLDEVCGGEDVDEVILALVRCKAYWRSDHKGKNESKSCQLLTESDRDESSGDRDCGATAGATCGVAVQ